MDPTGRGLLRRELSERIDATNKLLRDVRKAVLLTAAAVELWTQLNESAELGNATVAHLAAQAEQTNLEVLVGRLERGLNFLDGLRD